MFVDVYAFSGILRLSESIECLEYLINKKIYNKVSDAISHFFNHVP